MRRTTTFEPLPEFDTWGTNEDENSDGRAQRSDRKAFLFQRLRKWASPRHLPIIEAWEKVYDHTDRIPTMNGSRKSAHEIRLQARIIFEAMGMEEGSDVNAGTQPPGSQSPHTRRLQRCCDRRRRLTSRLI